MQNLFVKTVVERNKHSDEDIDVGCVCGSFSSAWQRQQPRQTRQHALSTTSLHALWQADISCHVFLRTVACPNILPCSACFSSSSRGARHTLKDTTPNTMEKLDPNNKMKAQRAATDLNFQALTGIVADGKATINEHKEFEAHVNWRTGIRRVEREALEAKEARANTQQHTTTDTIAPRTSSLTFPSNSAASPSSLPQGQYFKDFEPID